MQNIFGLKPELARSLKSTFSTFTIIQSGGRPVKSKSGRISKEVPHEGKEIIVATVREFNIVWN